MAGGAGGLHIGEGHADPSNPAQPYQDLIAQSGSADHHHGFDVDTGAGGATSLEHAHDVTGGEGADQHHGEVPAPAGDYLAPASSHEGDAGQAPHGAGHDQGAPEYAQMAGDAMPHVDHQPIAPDQLFAEAGGAHGAADVDHGLQPMHHDAAAAAQAPAVEMPMEVEHGHHG
jgi:hypothetical protein